jgi:flagellar L-ring protein precursor FlgH
MRLFQLTHAILAVLALSGCSDLAHVGREPDFSPLAPNLEHQALYTLPLPDVTDRRRAVDTASLWSSGQRSLLGDRRASRPGDILTVVIEIDDRAEISNSSQRGRSGAQSMGVPQLFGLPQRADARLPEGASMATAVDLDSSSSFQGSGSVSRNERLTLRVATTIIERLPNGVVRIEGSQEVRVNNELRELIVSGYIRPEDISRRNEIDYDRIAGARISYGGRGQISQMQQPRYGQQLADILLPF